MTDLPAVISAVHIKVKYANGCTGTHVFEIKAIMLALSPCPLNMGCKSVEALWIYGGGNVDEEEDMLKKCHGFVLGTRRAVLKQSLSETVFLDCYIS